MITLDVDKRFINADVFGLSTDFENLLTLLLFRLFLNDNLRCTMRYLTRLAPVLSGVNVWDTYN